MTLPTKVRRVSSTILVSAMIFAVSIAVCRAQLVINEFMARNDSVVSDPQGEYDDWIEIYNGGAAPVDIGGMFITDLLADPGRHEIPTNDAGATTIDPGGYLVLWADNDEEDGALHLGFQLSGGGEAIGLFDASVTLIDSITFGEQMTDVSFGRYPDGATNWFFMSPATPGSTNTPGFADAVQFSPPGGAFTNTVEVELSAGSSNAVIHYTLDGSVPTTASAVFTNPLSFSSNTRVRARVFEPGMSPGPIVGQVYLFADPSLQNFDSNLPLILVDSFGQNFVNGEDYKPVYSIFIDTQLTGRAAIVGQPDYAGRGGLKIRGSSSANFSKKSYSFETWNEIDQDRGVPLLGLPSESDWVLYAPYIDKTLIRNHLAYMWFDQMGRQSIRTRFVELYLNTSASPTFSMNEYKGIYVLIERIKRDENRIDVARLGPSDNDEPEVSGGYILKFDRLDPGDTGLGWPKGDTQLAAVYPDEPDLTLPQRNWITNFITDFETALYGPDFTNAMTGYAAYIDADSFIDYDIHSQMVKHNDSMRHSTYFFKDRSETLAMGPIWDSDDAMGTVNWNQFPGYSPENWWNANGFGDSRYAWWARLFEDPDYTQRWVDRWHELESGVFAKKKMMADIADATNLLEEAQVRNFQKWPVLGAYIYLEPPGWFERDTYPEEVDLMTNWIDARHDWIYDQFLTTPDLGQLGGTITSGFELTITSASHTIYYTLDGTDPRAPGGLPAGTQYTTPITLTENTLVRARVWDGAAWTTPVSKPPPAANLHWSGLTEAMFFVTPPEFAISEIMVAPREPTGGTETNYTASAFEFIELKNIGAGAASLLGFEFTGGVLFDPTHGHVTNVNVGDYILVVNNLAAFTNRYPNWEAMNIAGEFTGDLDNNGESIALSSTVAPGERWRITYDNGRGWPVAADGAGHSLVPLTDQPRLQDYGGNWRCSAFIDGSPGAADPMLPRSVVLNEFMAHTDFTNPALPEYDSDDWIELFNAGTATISLADWYLSDDAAALTQWTIPASNFISAGSWLSFSEVTGFHNPITNGFGLNKAGERIYLSHLPGTSADRVVDSVRFLGQEQTASLGRYADGGEYWRAMTPTRDTTNAAPIEHAAISEIMYHPVSTNVASNTRDEFIEIFNPLATAIDLWTTAGTWRLAGGVSYAFPTNTSLAPGEKILVVSFDPAITAARDGFLAAYTLTNGHVRLFGPYTAVLSDRGERVALERPQAPDLVGDPLSWVIVDEVMYYDRSPWSAGADGTGLSLQRTETSGAGREPANWAALAPTPGTRATFAISEPIEKAPYFLPVEIDVRAFVDVLQITGAVQEVRFYYGANHFGTDNNQPYEAALSYIGPPAHLDLRAEVQHVSGVVTSRTVRIFAQAIDNTQGPKGVAEDMAVLQGRLNGGGVAEVTFAWGTDDGGTNLNDWAYEQSIGTVGTGTFECVIENLQAGLNYRYRVRAVNDNGEAWSLASNPFSVADFDQWDKRMDICFSGYNETDTLTNFPALVVLSTAIAGFDYSQFGSPSGSDLRFSTAGGMTALSYDIEKWDPAGESQVWVQVPQLSGPSNFISAYWGNAGAVSPPPYALDGSTWSEDYELVLHLNGDLSDSAPGPDDVLDHETTDASGVIGNARDFESTTNSYLEPLIEPDWYGDHISNLTISVWGRPNSGTPKSPFGVLGTASDSIYIKPSRGQWSYRVADNFTVGSSMHVAQWQMLGIVLDNNTALGYHNDSQHNVGAYSYFAPPDRIRVGDIKGDDQYFDGSLDEVRISRVARSPAWMRASYKTVAQNSTFTSYVVVSNVPFCPYSVEYCGYIGRYSVVDSDPAADPDNDGATNHEEFISGTNPNDPNDVFRVLRIDVDDGSNCIWWTSGTNSGIMTDFTLLRMTNRVNVVFEELATGIARDPSGTNLFYDTNAPGTAYYLPVLPTNVP